DPKISSVYGMWLRQIARESVTANACLNIVGHTSNSGAGQSNDSLSLKRAAYIRQRLVAEAPTLTGRTQVTGMGFRQNIVGSGSAVDRGQLELPRQRADGLHAGRVVDLRELGAADRAHPVGGSELAHCGRAVRIRGEAPRDLIMDAELAQHGDEVDARGGAL